MKFLFCSLETPGFLFPSLGVAQALRARGHEVAYVADIECSRLICESGFRRISRGVKDGSSFKVAHWWEPAPVAIQVKHIEYALKSFPADILVGQSLTFGPLLVAERQSIPVGLLGFCTYLWPTADVPDEKQRASNEEARLRSRLSDMLRSFNEARKLFRLPPAAGRCRETPLLGDLFLVRSVPQLEVGFEQLPERVHLVGSCLWEPAGVDHEVDVWLEQAERRNLPVVYVQHGRFFHIPSFWPRLTQALPGSRYAVASSSGRLDSEPGDWPENFLVRSHLSQARILRVAQAVVSSANSTAVLGSLEAGIPMLLVPGGGEQPDVAEQAERAGVAKCLTPEEATPEAIGQAVESLLANPNYRQHAGLLQTAFLAVDGLERSAMLLERLASTRRPVLRDTVT